jgi:hypothetical protein
VSLSVFSLAADGLSRERWDFRAGMAHSDEAWMILVGYSVERRKQAKGRFSKATPADRWLSSDERSYNSGLPRPTTVPPWVLLDVQKQVAFRFYIGWTRSEYEVSPNLMRSAEIGG